MGRPFAVLPFFFPRDIEQPDGRCMNSNEGERRTARGWEEAKAGQERRPRTRNLFKRSNHSSAIELNYTPCCCKRSNRRRADGRNISRISPFSLRRAIDRAIASRAIVFRRSRIDPEVSRSRARVRYRQPPRDYNSALMAILPE